MIIKTIVLILFFSSLFLGCLNRQEGAPSDSSNSYSDDQSDVAVGAKFSVNEGTSALMAKPMSRSMAPEGAIQSEPAPEPNSGDSITQERKLVKNGSITLQVNSLSKQIEAQKFIKTKAQEFSVTFDREDEQKWGNQANISLVARVPSEKFEDFLKALSGGPYNVTNRSVNVSEVTEQYIDLEVRLQNKKELRERYRVILKSANKIKDILAINKSIEEVTSEIESTEGQFRYLKKQVAHSVLNIQITAELPVTMQDQNGFFHDAWQSLHQGWRRMRNFVLSIFEFWPFLIIFAGIVWGIKFWRKKRNED